MTPKRRFDDVFYTSTRLGCQVGSDMSVWDGCMDMPESLVRCRGMVRMVRWVGLASQISLAMVRTRTGRRTMALEFDGITYQTIIDIREKYKVSEKTINRMIRNKEVSEPEKIIYGSRKFRHFSDEWCRDFEKQLQKRVNS